MPGTVIRLSFRCHLPAFPFPVLLFPMIPDVSERLDCLFGQAVSAHGYVNGMGK